MTTADTLARAALDDDVALLALADVLEEAGDPRAETVRRFSAAMRCLVIRYPQEDGASWCGQTARNRRLVPRGHGFDGREGETREGGTGWYEPVGWLSPVQAAEALAANAWDEESHDAAGWALEVICEYAGGLLDWPGLSQHYPSLAI